MLMAYGVLHFEEQHALDVYSYFMLGVYMSYVPGALLGDLLLGNKRATVIGAGLMAIGAFSLCVPNPLVFYAGLALICLGIGLFDSNFLSLYAKNYLGRKSKMDAGFALLYAVVNFGAMAGAMLVSGWMNSFDYYISAIVGGLLLAGAAIVSSFVKSESTGESPEEPNPKSAFTIVAGVILLAAFYWTIYEFGMESTGSIQRQLLELHDAPISWLIQANVGLFIVPICLTAALVWTLVHYSSWAKLAMGFLCGALAFSILHTIPGHFSSATLPLYMLAILLLALAEINIQPIVYAFIAKHSNPKYLAIVFSLVTMPTKILAYIYPAYQLHAEGNERNEFLICAVLLAVVSVGVGVSFMTKRNAPEWA